jgi:hypothetical protein
LHSSSIDTGQLADAIAKAIASALPDAPPQGSDASIPFLIIEKANDRRILTAVTNIVSDGNGRPIVDHDGDIIDAENLDEMFIKAFADGGIGKSGTMHEARGHVDVVEHFVFTKRDWAGLGTLLGKDLVAMPELGIVKLRVNDDRVWADVKSGRYPEVSIEGAGERVPV